MKNLVITFDSFIYEQQLDDFINEFDNIDFILVDNENYFMFTIDYMKYNKVLIFETTKSLEFKEDMEYLGLYYDMEVKYFKSHEMFYILNNCYNLVGGC